MIIYCLTVDSTRSDRKTNAKRKSWYVLRGLSTWKITLSYQAYRSRSFFAFWVFHERDCHSTDKKGKGTHCWTVLFFLKERSIDFSSHCTSRTKKRSKMLKESNHLHENCSETETEYPCLWFRPLSNIFIFSQNKGCYNPNTINTNTNWYWEYWYW